MPVRVRLMEEVGAGKARWPPPDHSTCGAVVPMPRRGEPPASPLLFRATQQIGAGAHLQHPLLLCRATMSAMANPMDRNTSLVSIACILKRYKGAVASAT